MKSCPVRPSASASSHPLRRFLPLFIALLAFDCLALGREFEFGGFISTGYLKSSHYNYLADSEEGTTAFTEMGLHGSWTPRKRTTVNGEIFAFELGPYGNYEPKIDYLFLDYNFSHQFGIQIGRVNREFGLYTHLKDIDITRASILLPMGTYDHRYRYNSSAVEGGAAYGTFGILEDTYLDYFAYIGRSEVHEDGGLVGYALTNLSRHSDDLAICAANSKTTFGGQLWLNPSLERFRVGLGFSRFQDIHLAADGNFNPDFPSPFLAGQGFLLEANDLNVSNLQLSAEYAIGNWTFVGEKLWTDTDFQFTALIGSTLNPPQDLVSDSQSWYLSVERQFGPFQTTLTYSEESNNSARIVLPAPPRTSKDLQLSLRYDIYDFWSMKAEIHDIEGTGRLFNQFQQNPVLDESDWTLLALKSTFSY